MSELETIKKYYYFLKDLEIELKKNNKISVKAFAKEKGIKQPSIITKALLESNICKASGKGRGIRWGIIVKDITPIVARILMDEMIKIKMANYRKYSRKSSYKKNIHKKPGNLVPDILNKYQDAITEKDIIIDSLEKVIDKITVDKQDIKMAYNSLKEVTEERGNKINTIHAELKSMKDNYISNSTYDALNERYQTLSIAYGKVKNQPTLKESEEAREELLLELAGAKNRLLSVAAANATLVEENEGFEKQIKQTSQNMIAIEVSFSSQIKGLRLLNKKLSDRNNILETQYGRRITWGEDKMVNWNKDEIVSVPQIKHKGIIRKFFKWVY